MTSGILQYQLPTFTGLLRHGMSSPSLVRDMASEHDGSAHQEVDAQVRSGDYFVMLATILDSLSRNIDSFAARAKLEDVVSDLIYLQDSHTITKNKPTE